MTEQIGCVDSLEGVAQEEADLATGVTLFTFTLVPFGSVELWLDLPNAGYLLLLLTVEIGAGELVSHGLRPKHSEGRGHTHLHGKIICDSAA